MIDPATLHRWGFSLFFLILAALVIFVRMLPLGGAPGGMPPPDLIVLLGFAWVLHRPDFVPVLLFATVLLITELLFQRPPGVTTALGVVGLEFLRGRAGLMREQSFAMEWATVAVVLGLILVSQRLLLALFVVEQGSFGLSVFELLVNILFYPMVVAVSVFAFRVRRLGPGEHAAEARLV